MLHVILLILKILLWIVLGLVSLVFLLLLLILFAPITYSADIKLDDNASVAARVRFLILSVRLDFDKNAKVFDTGIRVLGIKLGEKKESVREVEADLEELPEKVDEFVNGELKSEEDTIENEKSERREAAGDKEEEEKSETQEAAEDKEEEEKSETQEVAEDKSEEEKENNNEDIEEQTADDGNKSEEIEEKPNSKIDKKARRKKRKKGKNKQKESSLGNMNVRLEAIKKKLNRVGKFWELPCTVKLRAYLKKYIPGLFRHISPRKVKGHIRFGLNEPCKTGQVTGYLSLMPFVYQKGFYIEPDFYHKVLEGEIKLKGRLMLGYVLRIALNINVWRTIKAIKKI